MCVEGGRYVACYTFASSKKIAGLCGGERSTLLRQSRYRRRKANRDQTGIKCGEGQAGVGLGKGFRGFAETKERVG